MVRCISSPPYCYRTVASLLLLTRYAILSSLTFSVFGLFLVTPTTFITSGSMRKPKPQAEQSSENIVEIGSFVVGAVLVVFIAVIGCFCYRKSRSKKHQRETMITEYNRETEGINITAPEPPPVQTRPRRTASTSSTGSMAGFPRQRSMRDRLESRLTQLSEVEIPYDPQWEVDRNDVILGEVLGEGAFGRVIMAQAYGTKDGLAPCTVAVKMLKGLFLIH